MAYTKHDAERFVAEIHSSDRSPYARDRARIIHSSAWRRLAAKTQVLSPTSGQDFARNRLTHSLEVAQIGSEIADSLGLDTQLVDAACLAHDLGHPPFGHNGEKALDEWMKEYGGFEGNAQTLRILSRLEPKRFDGDGNSVGLNLTRAMLDASCKYPWGSNDAQKGDAGASQGTLKFGYFEQDKEVFEWFREGTSGNERCSESVVMDLADDIAYSVHDFEDAIVSGFIDPELLAAPSGHDVLISKIEDWTGGNIASAKLATAFERLANSESWLTSWNGSMSEQAQLKNFTSDMIGRFARLSVEHTLENAGQKQIARYGSPVIVPEIVSEEIAVLKGIVAAYVMASGERQPTYRRQRVLLTELLNTVWASGPNNLEQQFRDDFEKADSEADARRAVADQIASLTDQGAISWYKKLCVVPLV